MELIFGVIMMFVISLWIRFYMRYLAADGARVKPFEQWCRTQPLVLAFRCPQNETVDVYEIVRRAIEPWDSFTNSAGRYPWQHYVVDVDCKRLSDDIIAFYVTSCRPAKVREKPLQDVSKSVIEIGKAAGTRIEEVWLHGQFHAVNRVIGTEREKAGWLGAFREDGELEVAAMIGQPPWLKEVSAGR